MPTRVGTSALILSLGDGWRRRRRFWCTGPKAQHAQRCQHQNDKFLHGDPRVDAKKIRAVGGNLLVQGSHTFTKNEFSTSSRNEIPHSQKYAHGTLPRTSVHGSAPGGRVRSNTSACTIIVRKDARRAADRRHNVALRLRPGPSRPAGAASGHAPAPTSSVMNSRRFQ